MNECARLSVLTVMVVLLLSSLRPSFVALSRVPDLGLVARAGDRVLLVLARDARFWQSSFAQLGFPFVCVERTLGA